MRVLQVRVCVHMVEETQPILCIYARQKSYLNEREILHMFNYMYVVQHGPDNYSTLYDLG